MKSCQLPFAAALISVCSVQAALVDRQVTIDVEVRLPDGSPATGFPLDAGYADHYTVGTTDVNGHLELVMTIPEEWQEVIVRPTPAMRLDVSYEDKLAARDRFIELIDTVGLSTFYVVELDPLEPEYSLIIQASPAVRITGSVQHDTHGAIHAMIRAAERPFFVMQEPERGPGFAIGGIEQGAAADLFINAAVPYIMQRTLTAQETATDTDLGVLQFQPPPEEGTLRLTTEYEHEPRLSREGSRVDNTVSLISSDGTTIYNFKIGVEDEVARAFHSPSDYGNPRLAAGTYYAVPGFFFGTELQLTLLRLIREGAPLDPHGVPKVMIPVGGVGEIQYDPEQATQAIRAAAQ